MKQLVLTLFLTLSVGIAQAQETSGADSARQAAQKTEQAVFADSQAVDSELTAALNDVADVTDVDDGERGMHQVLKEKFIEGNAGFMSLVALALVLGLTFCIERIVYLTMSEIDARKFMNDLDAKLEKDDVEGAKELCRNTRGPVASICMQGLLHINDKQENLERTLANYGSVLAANLEKGCSWITLFIAIAPSLGFLGTVIGMVMAFDQIQTAGDISPTIVAEGMKVALITTIFGIIVAVILQLFYNYILSKIDLLVAQMEEASVTLMDIIMREESGK